MKKFLSLFLTLGLVFFGVQSCQEDELLDLTNPNELSANTFYQNEVEAQAAVNVIYNAFQSSDLYRRRYFFVNDLLSGEAAGLGSLGGDMVQLEQRTLDASNPAIGEVWRGLYRGVHRANLVITNVPNTRELTDAKRNQFLGEAYFLRAWFYFDLASNFGAVPLLLEPAPISSVTTGLARSTQEQVMAQVISDLDAAAQRLPSKSQYDAGDAGRATSGAAMALKGKALLFQGDFAGAATALEAVVNSGEYVLMDEYFDNFIEESENNAESVFEIQFGVNNGGQWNPTGIGNGDMTFRAQEYGFREWRNVVPSQRLLDEYEDNDPRFGFNFYSPCDLFNNGQNTLYTPNACPPPAGTNPTTPDDLPSWRKYQNHYKFSNELFARSGINFRYLRYADVLLMLAEARAETGNIAGALELVNQVRQRPSVNMPPYPTADYPFGSTQEAINAIYHERAVELAGEQVLYRDLLRRPEFYPSWVPQAQLPKHLLLPIPQSEIENNAALTNSDQNPGY